MSMMATLMLARFHTEVCAVVRLFRRGDLTAEAAMNSIMESLVSVESEAQTVLNERERAKESA
jgi:hypothetical protein